MNFFPVKMGGALGCCLPCFVRQGSSVGPESTQNTPKRYAGDQQAPGIHLSQFSSTTPVLRSWVCATMPDFVPPSSSQLRVPITPVPVKDANSSKPASPSRLPATSLTLSLSKYCSKENDIVKQHTQISLSYQWNEQNGMEEANFDKLFVCTLIFL